MSMSLRSWILRTYTPIKEPQTPVPVQNNLYKFKHAITMT